MHRELIREAGAFSTFYINAWLSVKQYSTVGTVAIVLIWIAFHLACACGSWTPRNCKYTARSNYLFLEILTADRSRGWSFRATMDGRAKKQVVGRTWETQGNEYKLCSIIVNWNAYDTVLTDVLSCVCDSLTWSHQGVERAIWQQPMLTTAGQYCTVPKFCIISRYFYRSLLAQWSTVHTVRHQIGWNARTTRCSLEILR